MRPSTKSEPKARIHLELSPALRTRLKSACKDIGITESELIRRILDKSATAALQKRDEAPPPPPVVCQLGRTDMMLMQSIATRWGVTPERFQSTMLALGIRKFIENGMIFPEVENPANVIQFNPWARPVTLDDYDSAS